MRLCDEYTMGNLNKLRQVSQNALAAIYALISKWAKRLWAKRYKINVKTQKFGIKRYHS